MTAGSMRTAHSNTCGSYHRGQAVAQILWRRELDAAAAADMLAWENSGFSIDTRGKPQTAVPVQGVACSTRKARYPLISRAMACDSSA